MATSGERGSRPISSIFMGKRWKGGEEKKGEIPSLFYSISPLLFSTRSERGFRTAAAPPPLLPKFLRGERKKGWSEGESERFSILAPPPFVRSPKSFLMGKRRN